MIACLDGKTGRQEQSSKTELSRPNRGALSVTNTRAEIRGKHFLREYFLPLFSRVCFTLHPFQKVVRVSAIDSGNFPWGGEASLQRASGLDFHGRLRFCHCADRADAGRRLVTCAVVSERTPVSPAFPACGCVLALIVCSLRGSFSQLVGLPLAFSKHRSVILCWKGLSVLCIS